MKLYVVSMAIALGLPCALAGEQQKQARFPIPVALKDIRVHDELGERLEASINRLEDELYRVPKLYDEPNEGWPGDKEGRTLLGLVMLSQVTGRDPKYLKDIIDAYPLHVNARGYLGPVLSPDSIPEQTLGGHFWLVRAFYEYAAWKHDERALAWADQLISNV